MFGALKNLWSKRSSDADKISLETVVKKTPTPVFWLFGKTQTGKTSIIRYLTGADDAEIGRGFRPCTRFSREFSFPSDEAPLLRFLDTRGLEEPGYDAAEDIARFSAETHVLIVTTRVLDFALDSLRKQLRKIRADQPHRPVLVVLTCLHEAYPQMQHTEPYPFLKNGEVNPEHAGRLPEGLTRAVAAQREQFVGLFHSMVPVDLTPEAEGFANPNYGGDQLKETLIEALPSAYRQTLLKLDEITRSLRDPFERKALPYILGYSSAAASAGAIPIPWVDLLILPAIQAQMVNHLGRLYGQPLSGQRFLELAGTLGMGMLVRQGVRELAKFIPFVGSVASAALAGAATFALGRAFCFYYGAVLKGHVPSPEELKAYYAEELAQARKLWSPS